MHFCIRAPPGALLQLALIHPTVQQPRFLAASETNGNDLARILGSHLGLKSGAIGLAVESPCVS
jgi:hypothetical protein